ncbi:AI-2E family transporter [Gillisia sp. Q332]|uniref:AI-2E family transporter n=1 Tax=Gillisia xinjiangensis TaxID=3384765 RepID=UPI003918C4E8
MSQGKRILLYSTLVFVGGYFLFTGLVEAKGFLAPLLTGVILALVVLPLSRKMEKAGMGRGITSLLSTFLIFLFSLGLIWLISFQVKSFIDDWPEIKETMKPKVEQLRSFVMEQTPLSKEDMDISGEDGEFSLIAAVSQKSEKALGFFSQTFGFFGTYLLVFIYTFFLLNYRNKFKRFIVLLFPDEKKKEIQKVVGKSGTVVQEYLVGTLLLMLFLGIVYSIGLGITGIDNFILVSFIAAFLTLIPVVGNIIGFSLALILGYLTTGETSALIGVIITFSVAQMLENYVLQPFVIGDKVDLHPFFVILAVILGGATWGIIGMILAIPVMAIITIISLNVPALYPFGFLFSKKAPDKKS